MKFNAPARYKSYPKKNQLVFARNVSKKLVFAVKNL